MRYTIFGFDLSKGLKKFPREATDVKTFDLKGKKGWTKTKDQAVLPKNEIYRKP